MITVLQFASRKIQDEKEVVIAAISNDGNAFQYASERLRDDKEVILA